MNIIRVDEKIYNYYEYVTYHSLAEEINNELDYLRQVLKEADKESGLKNIPYRLGLYEEDKINALAIKDGSEYIIGISSGAYEKIRSWCYTFFSYKKTYEVLGIKSEDRDYYSNYTFRKALEFLVLHEYVHIKDGHLNIPNNKQKLMCEQSKKISKEEALFSQTTECIADMWAVAQCTNNILKENTSFEKKDENLKLLVFAVYTIFKKFSEDNKYDFNSFMEDDLLLYTHPMAWIRYRYIMGTIFTNIPDSSETYKERLTSDLVNAIMDFENNVLEVNDLSEKMYVLAHTQKGTDHLILLHDYWNEIADVLKDYAHVELTKVVPLGKEAEKLVIIDNNGNLIK